MWQRDSDGELIVLDDSLDRRARRCALAHELIHAERGIGHGAASVATMEREEELVRRETARRLVPLDELAAFAIPRDGIDPVTVVDVMAEFDVDAAVARKALELLVHRLTATDQSMDSSPDVRVGSPGWQGHSDAGWARASNTSAGPPA